MHPQWLGEGDLPTFVEPLRRAGLSALEFELDRNQALWLAFEPLMLAAAELGLDLSFHAPFRAPYSLIGFAGKQRDQIIQDYHPMLDIAEQWGRRLGSNRVVVVHAAVSNPPAVRESLVADTRAFLSWGLDAFPHIQFALENNSLAKGNEVKIGEQLTGVLALIDALNDPRLKACWDMGHDYMVRGPASPPQAWLSAVAHVHVHDVNVRGNDHYPLIYQRVPFQVWLQHLVHVRMKGMVMLELKGGHLSGWPPAKIKAVLVRSIASITKIVE
ncbi:MAG: TIM barrel protein [Anaerolineaceae bacterium]|nr:TIM barrel protein [Anaerolineaceae bacterium]